jgi:hypothetical protein
MLFLIIVARLTTPGDISGGYLRFATPINGLFGAAQAGLGFLGVYAELVDDYKPSGLPLRFAE